SSFPPGAHRPAAFRGVGYPPGAALGPRARRLVDAGAGLVVMPCNTAHLWWEALATALGLPMLHLVDAALAECVHRIGRGARIGLLATDATIASGLYPNRTPEGSGLQWLMPTAAEMLQGVMPGIGAVKSGRLPEARALLQPVAEALARRGAQALVLGCTEIPLVVDERSAPVPVIDATDALARQAVAWSMAQRVAMTA
ncbi:MAG: aspartate/glutamate racemase family protein, partial [Aquincola tertiaricarbonis]